MGDDTVKLMEELCRAKQTLSEVIDECVFVERQRDQVEQRLTGELKERDRVVADTFSSLLSLIEYLALLERRVIVPALGSFSAVVKKVPEVGVTRSWALGRVEETLSAHNSEYFRGVLARMSPIAGEIEKEIRQMIVDTPVPFSLEEAYVLLRALLEEKDKLIEKINETLFHLNDIFVKVQPSRSPSMTAGNETRELRQKLTALTQELEIRDNEKRETAQRLTILQKSLDSRRKNVEELHRLREIIERQERTIEFLRLSTGSMSQAKIDTTTSDYITRAGSSSNNNNNGVGHNVDVEELIPQLKANEMTIAALNKELAILEENYRALERRSEKEREELQAELVSARNRHQEEQEECNTVLGRVTMELEQLVNENAQLKKRLKQKHASQVH